MFGSGLENVKNCRFSHLLQITSKLRDKFGKDSPDDLTVNIERKNENEYSVFWMRNDHYGGGIDFIFENNLIQEVEETASWIS